MTRARSRRKPNRGKPLAAAEARVPWVSPRHARWPWRDYLTQDERVLVAHIDRDFREGKDLMMRATARINPIRNRAVQRAKRDFLSRLRSGKGKRHAARYSKVGAEWHAPYDGQ